MSERPQLFKDMNDFGKELAGFDYDLLETPDECWVRGRPRR